jgi:hypothetical protein
MVCSALGALVGCLLLAMVAANTYRRARGHSARLRVMGSVRRLGDAVHSTAVAIATLVAVGLGILVGLLMAITYNIAAGIVTGPGRLGVTVATIAVVAGALAVAASWFTANTTDESELLELMHRE